MKDYSREERDIAEAVMSMATRFRHNVMELNEASCVSVIDALHFRANEIGKLVAQAQARLAQENKEWGLDDDRQKRIYLFTASILQPMLDAFAAEGLRLHTFSDRLEKELTSR